MKARFKPKYNIRKGDSVVIIAGDDKDLAKPRNVKQVLVDEAQVLVEGVNIITRHTISNVMLWDAKSKAPAKVTRERKDGKTYRVSKKSGERI